MIKRTRLIASALVGLSLHASPSVAEFQRGYVAMMGSSTIVPFVKEAAEKATSHAHIHAPLIQASGTGGGIKLFCEGFGPESPDVALASRAMKPKEREECERNGIAKILEVKIGYDALILTQSAKAEPWALTHDEARMAFAKWIVSADGTMALNPNHQWKDVKASLPNTRIELLGPPATSGSHDAFLDLISELECKKRPWVPEGPKDISADLQRKCRSVREDGIYKEGRDNDLSHVDMIATNPTPAIGLFGYKMLTDHSDKLRAIPIDGIEPSYANISSGTYRGARPLYLYVKARNVGVTPGLSEFLAEITSEGAFSDKGYLRKAGLITLPAQDRAAMVALLRDAGVSPAHAGAPSKPSQGATSTKK